jgi:fumarylacetoacetase
VSWIDIPDGSPFPITNLPLGVGHTGDGNSRAWVAIGAGALDLAATATSGLLAEVELPPGCLADPSLNRFLAAGADVWSSLRQRLMELLGDRSVSDRLSGHVVGQRDLTMGVPVAPVDYVDFYSSIHHATNLGRLFRPDGDALMPNWRRIPIGYHGRSGTLLPDGASIRRPAGYRLIDGAPEVGPSGRLDIELEVGTVIGVGSDTGTPIPIDSAGRHLYGMCLVNDWSARDIQAYEYQPLGPFLGKSFATSVSPWLVSFEALAPFRIAPPAQNPPVAEYLSTDEPWGFDLHLEVWLDTARMRAAGEPPALIAEVPFADMYWTPAQQLAHLTVNGAGTSAGDLFASGTVSGPTPESVGSLIERTWNGDRPLVLPDGSRRTFLEDGDRVELRGWAGSDPATRLGFGAVSGTIIGANDTHDTHDDTRSH